MGRHQPFLSANPYFCTCGGASKVLDSRVKRHYSSVRRRRECLTCGLKWTTHEIREDAPAMESVAKLEAITAQAQAITEQEQALRLARRELQRRLTTRGGMR